MAKVLVLYYSTYGHVETLADAVAEGARSVPGTAVTLKRVPELMPPDVARQARPESTRRQPARACRLRRDHRRRADALRAHARADGQFPRPDRRALDARQAQRQDRQRLFLDRVAAWRTGDDALQHHHQSLPFGAGRGRPALQRAGAAAPG